MVPCFPRGFLYLVVVRHPMEHRCDSTDKYRIGYAVCGMQQLAVDPYEYSLYTLSLSLYIYIYKNKYIVVVVTIP